MPQTSFARAFQNITTDIHGYFKKTLFTILWASSPEHTAASFYSGFAVRDTWAFSLYSQHIKEVLEMLRAESWNFWDNRTWTGHGWYFQARSIYNYWVNCRAAKFKNHILSTNISPPFCSRKKKKMSQSYHQHVRTKLESDNFINDTFLSPSWQDCWKVVLSGRR